MHRPVLIPAGRLIMAMLLVLCTVPLTNGLAGARGAATSHLETIALMASPLSMAASRPAIEENRSDLQATTAVTPTATTATISVTPTSVVAGETVAIIGTGFTAGEAVDLQLVTTGTITGTRQLVFVRVDGKGTFAAEKVKVPGSTRTGKYLLRALGLTSLHVASQAIDVQAPVTTISVSTTTFAPNDVIKVMGSKFGPGEKVTIALATPSGSASLPLGQAQADASGAFSVSLHVPFGVQAGMLLLVATGQSTSRQVTVRVQVNASSATLVVAPTNALPGERVDVSGTHFQPGETVHIDLVALSTSTRIGTTQVNQAGSFSLKGVAIPANTPESTVSLVATGANSRLSASAQLKIGSRPANLTLTPDSIKAGGTLALRGHGFIPGETVTVVLSGGKLPPVTLGTALAGTDGSFGLGQLVVPTFVPAGQYSLKAIGQASGRVASGTLTVQAPPAAAPLISILDTSHRPNTPYSLSPGGFVQVAGSNFSPGAQITLVLAGGNGTISLVTVAANGGGALGPIGLTIPATTPAGSYALEARVGGNKVASVNTTVAFRTLRLTVTPGTLVPGSSVTVRGSGFAPGEQVVLALNGSALLTNPTTVLADANGNISLSFVVPETVTNGSNAITASGASSRASVTQSVQASLPTATRLYFANGDTTGNTQTVLTMLNANDVPSTVKLTFLYQNQAETTYSQVIPAHSVANADLGLAAGPGRRISTILEADRQISAVSTTSFAGGDNETTPGANGPSRIWYLAEGYTNGSFREFLTVMNPGTTFATIDVRFLPFNDRPAREARFVMQPRSNIQIDAGLYVPGQSISAIVTADHSVVVERSMRFGANGRGAHDKIGISTASTVWAFAQGESGPSRQTFFTILNPSQAAPAAVTATFFDQAGKPVGSKTIIVNPLRRGNIKLNDVLPNAQVATILTSNVPVVVERPIYQSSADLGSAPSGSVIFGRNGGAGSWAFPSGSTANGDRTLLYLFNPGTKPVAVTATFYTATGGTLKQALTLAPNSDTVLDLSSVQGLPAGPIGTVLRSTDSQSFIAEETVLNATAQRASSTQGIAQ